MPTSLEPFRKLSGGAVAVALLMAGCGRGDPTPLGAGSIDPCAVALAPHRGDASLDRDIARLQDRARKTAAPGAILEQLGWAFVAKARVSFDPGFYKLAEQCALCLLARNTTGAEPLLLRGHALHAMHRFQEAEALARELVARRGLAFDHGLLGDALLEQGKLAEAAGAYQAMMDQRPGPEAYVRAAHLGWLKGDLAGAISLMDMAVGVSGFRDPEAAAWAHTRLALLEFQAGRRVEAARRLDRALALLPRYAPALLARGRLLLARERATEAVEPLAQAARLNPLPEYEWTLAEALRASDRRPEADRVEAQLLERGPASDRRTFALYLASVGRDAAGAVRLAEEELEVRRDVFTLDVLAWALRAAGRPEEAWAHSQRALAEGTRDARLYYHAGAIAAALGRRDEAARWLARARALGHMLLPSERVHVAREEARLATGGGAARRQGS